MAVVLLPVPREAFFNGFLMKVEVAGLMDPFGHISGALFFMVTGT